MLVLAVDSATPCAGVALVEDNNVLYEELANLGKTHSQTLMPMIDRALQVGGFSIMDLSAIAVTVGPGSFTGLRIGMGTVKGLSLASGKPIVAVSTLETIAYNLTGLSHLVGVLLDARKQEVYTAVYDVQGFAPQALSAELAISPEEFVDLAWGIKVKYKYENIILLGDGYYPYADLFQTSFASTLLPIAPHFMLPRPAALGSLALAKIKSGEYADIYSLSPVYLRLSEAEYKLKRGEL
ncbi:MAG TPA: tRNA (adenosine(37)-N6)-threonylcarbamoyltransferase complex dimerization subunit type 1 TsaB [Syntrophomonadaceae bacterium]|nr:tRNA (adenosine(37)-N6)-threonylcarbamoyltransferase complex dimerization subunit type 1 TsaB [Syntrophomonadaceae bacterium]